MLTEEQRVLVNSFSDDRLKDYEKSMLTQKPLQHFKQIRAYWVAGIVVNVLALIMTLISINNIITENASSPLLLKRIDGVIVEEAFDVRREVMLRNTLKQVESKEAPTDVD